MDATRTSPSSAGRRSRPGSSHPIAAPAAVAVLAMAALGVLLVVGGRPRLVVAAQIWGGPPAGDRTIALRLSVVDRVHGVDAPHPDGSISVTVAAANGARGAWRGRTDDEGTVEARVDLGRAPEGPLDAVVEAPGIPVPLAAGPIAPPAAWGETGETAVRKARLRGAGSGAVRVAVARGALVVGFPEDLIVAVGPPQGPLSPAGTRVEAIATGATVVPAGAPWAGADRATATAGADGRARFRVVAAAHAAELRVEATGPVSGVWEGKLPVVPGAMWADPDAARSGVLRVVSPVPRERAWITIASERARTLGAAVPMRPDGTGRCSGEIALPRIDPAAPTWAVVSSDFRAAGSGTIGWPIAGPADPFDLEARVFRDALLLDGFPRAAARERARVARMRWLALAVLGAAAVAEAVLLVRLARADAGALRRGVEDALGDAEPAARIASRPALEGWRLWLALLAVAALFGALAVAAVWKLGG